MGRQMQKDYIIKAEMQNKKMMEWMLVAVLLSMVRCEEWFMPDSRLISDVEFREAVKGDSYKIIKFFTPNCVYCRYLKNVFDKLKHEKEWSFAIYDLNCNWYPRLCQELKIGSFPYTAIYDQHGQLNNQINGFYPEPVIRNIFQQIEVEVVALARKALSNNNSLQTEQATTPVQESQENIEQDRSVQENIHIEEEKQQVKQINIEVKENHEIKKELHEFKKQNLQNDHKPSLSQSSVTPQGKLEQSERHSEGLPGIYQHIFFGFVILLGVIYFSSFMDLMKPTSKPNPESYYSSKSVS